MEVAFLLFLAATAIQLFYWLVVFSKLAFYKPKKSSDNNFPPVSIILCACNEAENLQQNLPYFLNQTYPKFEVLVVDDFSTDKSAEIVWSFQKSFANLQLIQRAGVKKKPGKKEALALGIENARYDIVALSDADCQPASADWLRQMQSALRGEVQIGLGYSPYRIDRGFLNLFIRFETTFSAIQYLSFALIGSPYMGVGRNLIYKKSLFYQTSGFQTHTDIASGDDDLFINEAAQLAKSQIIIHPSSFVFSEPKRTWKSYYRQKSRHLSTATRYRLRHKVLLGALSVSHALHYLLAVSLLASSAFIIPTFTLVLVRTAVVSWTYYNILHKQLKDTTLVRWVPLLDAVYVLFYFVLAPALLIGRKDVWKQ
jgi:cellulose synthase/poly-beta-1,6-N-acetylglucosamine synthase-like glycosyltransferase